MYLRYRKPSFLRRIIIVSQPQIIANSLQKNDTLATRTKAAESDTSSPSSNFTTAAKKHSETTTKAKSIDTKPKTNTSSTRIKASENDTSPTPSSKIYTTMRKNSTSSTESSSNVAEPKKDTSLKTTDNKLTSGVDSGSLPNKDNGIDATLNQPSTTPQIKPEFEFPRIPNKSPASIRVNADDSSLDSASVKWKLDSKNESSIEINRDGKANISIGDENISTSTNGTNIQQKVKIFGIEAELGGKVCVSAQTHVKSIHPSVPEVTIDSKLCRYEGEGMFGGRTCVTVSTTVKPSSGNEYTMNSGDTCVSDLDAAIGGAAVVTGVVSGVVAGPAIGRAVGAIGALSNPVMVNAKPEEPPLTTERKN